MQKPASIDRHSHCSKIDAISKIAGIVGAVEAGGEFQPRQIATAGNPGDIGDE